MAERLLSHRQDAAIREALEEVKAYLDVEIIDDPSQSSPECGVGHLYPLVIAALDAMSGVEPR